MPKFDTSFKFGANAARKPATKPKAPRRPRKPASGKWSGKRGAAFRASLGS